MLTPRNKILWANHDLFTGVVVSFGFGSDYSYLAHKHICAPKAGDVVIVAREDGTYHRGDVVGTVEVTQKTFDVPWSLSVIVNLDNGTDNVDDTLWKKIESRIQESL